VFMASRTVPFGAINVVNEYVDRTYMNARRPLVDHAVKGVVDRDGGSSVGSSSNKTFLNRSSSV